VQVRACGILEFDNSGAILLGIRSDGHVKARTDKEHYLMRVQQELDMAALATDPVIRVLHLNMAAQYATLRERAELEISNARCGAGE
jgi:hypothetical protein